ncbi:MAG: hypothetical protein GTO17_11230 [Candidatus Aminicenantes bacterium]|nr:hypothetical protein [Candidatus Aminicenantes bacterium]
MNMKNNLVGLLLTCLLLCPAQNSYAPSIADTRNAQIQSVPAKASEIVENFVDKKDWVIVDIKSADFGDDVKNALVALLKSSQPKAEGGAGQPLHEVRLMIISDDRILYDSSDWLATHRPPRPDVDAAYYMGGALGIKDVTADSIPEVIFHSGWAFASGHVSLAHVLSYIPNPRLRSNFQDIADKRFYFSTVHYVKWLEMDGTVYAVVAEGLGSKHFTICPTCERYYQYLLMRWDNTRKTFIITHSIQSWAMIYGDPTKIQGELDYIKKKYSVSQK